MGARLLPQSYQYPNLSEGADCVGGQMHRDKECPFSGVTKSGRVWRKVPESDAWSECVCVCVCLCTRACVCACMRVSACVGVYACVTLRASLSGTFLQTLSDLVTPLRGHSTEGAAVHRRGQRPPKGSGTNKVI